MASASSLASLAIVAGDLVKTGGMDRANYALADFASRTLSDVHVVSHRVAHELAARESVTVHHVPKPLRSYMLGEPLLDHWGRRTARRLARRGGLTVVNGGNCRGGEINWVHYVHAAYRPPVALGRRALVRAVYGARARANELAALRRARVVIANSAATRRVLVELLEVPEERVFVVYYGIDAAAFAPRAITPSEARRELGWEDRPTIAFVGALGDERKGFDTLFAAWQQLCRRPGWDANLVAIGAGADVSTWTEKSRAAGLESRVRLLGFRDDVPRLLAACDGLVSPTRYEAFGLGVAEAIATGLPAIVSAAAGVAELYPQSLANLLLGEADSVAELVQRLDAWRALCQAKDPALQAFSERVRSRGWDVMASEIIALAERHAE